MDEVKKAVQAALDKGDYNKAAYICSSTWNRLKAQGKEAPDMLCELSRRIVDVRFAMTLIKLDLERVK